MPIKSSNCDPWVWKEIQKREITNEQLLFCCTAAIIFYKVYFEWSSVTNKLMILVCLFQLQNWQRTHPVLHIFNSSVKNLQVLTFQKLKQRFHHTVCWSHLLENYHQNKTVQLRDFKAACQPIEITVHPHLVPIWRDLSEKGFVLTFK